MIGSNPVSPTSTFLSHPSVNSGDAIFFAIADFSYWPDIGLSGFLNIGSAPQNHIGIGGAAGMDVER
jgi:hypothetical protein